MGSLIYTLKKDIRCLFFELLLFNVIYIETRYMGDIWMSRCKGYPGVYYFIDMVLYCLRRCMCYIRFSDSIYMEPYRARFLAN